MRRPRGCSDTQAGREAGKQDHRAEAAAHPPTPPQDHVPTARLPWSTHVHPQPPLAGQRLLPGHSAVRLPLPPGDSLPVPPTTTLALRRAWHHSGGVSERVDQTLLSVGKQLPYREFTQNQNHKELDTRGWTDTRTVFHGA